MNESNESVCWCMDDAARAAAPWLTESTEPPACLASAMEKNECEEDGNAGCWKGPPGYNFSACVDTFRGYKCVCPAGFSGDGVTCEDIDECGPHDPPMNACEQKCTNTVGGHKCECNDGFRLVGAMSCIMIDYCVESGDNGGCQQGCVPRVGGHNCTCTIEGYELAEDGKTCALTARAQQAMEAAAAAAAGKSAARGGGGGGGTSVGGVVGITFFVLTAVALSGFAVYRWKIKSQIDREVRAIMTEYLPLDDEQGAGHGRGSGGGGGSAAGGAAHRNQVQFGGGSGIPSMMTMSNFSSSPRTQPRSPAQGQDTKMIPMTTTRQTGGVSGDDDEDV